MERQDRPLRRGWTTGTCATAAAKAAFAALVTGDFPDPVEVTLPRGERPSFALALTRKDEDSATAGVVKDAGDDPDVTHGALILATVRAGAPGVGVTFRAGEGVGTVTRPGLPVPPGEPAINPVPRRMIRDAIAEVAAAAGCAADAEVEIAIPGGEALAAQDAQRPARHRRRPVDPRHHRHRRALFVLGLDPFDPPRHRRGARRRARRISPARPASTSEAAVQKLYGLPEIALIDMGDFVGGMLKYLRAHPVPRVTIAGGVGKMTKLAQGLLDLHSKRGAVDHRARWPNSPRGRRLGRAVRAHRGGQHRRAKPLRWRRPKASRSAMRSRARSDAERDRPRSRRVVCSTASGGRRAPFEIRRVFDRDRRSDCVGPRGRSRNADSLRHHAAPPRNRRR